RLSWEVEALDLDRDGLTRAEEAAGGTSDWLRDSDGDGRDDGWERIVGTDPGEDDGDVARSSFDTTRAAWSLSPLLSAWRVPALAPSVLARDGAAGGMGIAGPLCVEHRCYDASGAVVAEAPD